MKTAGWQPYVVLSIGVSAVAWAAILVREADAPALIIAAYRLGLASIPMGALAIYQHRRAPEPISAGTVAPLVLSAAFLAAHFGFWIASLQHTTVVTAVVLMATQPLIVGIAAPLLLGEAVDRRVWLALGVALAGTAAMAIEDAGEALGTVAGDLYAVLGGIFAAGYLMVGRYARPGTSWLRYVGTVYPIAAVFLLASALVAGDSFTGYSTKTLLMIGLLALGPQLIGHSAINWSLAYLPVMLVAMAILVEPVGSTILATLILDERPSGVEMAGGALVLVGVYLALRPERQAEAVVAEVAEVTAAD
jgi:drug/metabolite transporter (DMT)-like permease